MYRKMTADKAKTGGLTATALLEETLQSTVNIDCLLSVLSFDHILLCVPVFVLMFWCHCSPLWAQGCCRISRPRFLAECRKKRLNQVSFGLLCFVLFVFLGCPLDKDTAGWQEFTVAGPWLWNCLPVELRQWDMRLRKCTNLLRLNALRLFLFKCAMYK